MYRRACESAEDLFEDQFYMVFDSTGAVQDVVHFAPLFERYGAWSNHHGSGPDALFYHCLSMMDRGRFLEFCAIRPSRSLDPRTHMALFRLDSFYGYTFAFAEKRREQDDLVYVRFFNDSTRFAAHVMPAYREALTAWGRYRTAPTSDIASVGANGPHFVDLFCLLRELVRQLENDPGFYGNRLILTGDGTRLHSPTEGHRYPLYYSAPVLTGAVYAVLTAMADATCTHNMELHSERDQNEAVLRLLTTINRPERLGRRTPQAISDYDRTLLQFAFNVAERAGIVPSVRFSDTTRCLTVTFRVSDLLPREGDFRCPSEAEDAQAVVADAGRLAALLSGRHIAIE